MRRDKPFVRPERKADCPDRAPDMIYTTTDGYRCLRWNAEGVEMLEHRYVTDAPPGMHVHHRNEQRDDNRPENLQVLTPGEHKIAHRDVPTERLLELHAEGLTTVAIGRLVGMHPSAVWRRLHAAGAKLGPRSPKRVEVDETEVLRRNAAGDRAPWIAAALGVSVNVVRRVIRRAGRKGAPPGRPPANSAALSHPSANMGGVS